MKYDLIIVRYAEIALKGKATRKRFTNTLVNNIKDALKTKNIQNRLRKEWGRIYIHSEEIEKSVDILQRIFGISSISPAMQTESRINEISKTAIFISKQKLGRKKSFAIRVNRTGNHDFTSQDVAVKIGNDIVKQTKASVNLTNPDFELFIEIRNDKAYIFIEKIKGHGGMPIGTQGKILALIDSKNSILASWYLIHRGCKPVFLLTSKIKKDVLERFLNYWFIKSKIIKISPIEKLYDQINKIAAENYCDAIVTGISFFENSENAMENIKQLKKQTDLPVLHPLIAINKEEINRKLKEIGLEV